MLKNREYVVRNNYIFLVKKLDDIAKLESRYFEINSKRMKLRSDLLSKIDDLLHLNQNIAIPTGTSNDDRVWSVWYREPNSTNLFSATLYGDNAKNWPGRGTIFYEKESVLTKLLEKELKFGYRTDVFRSALSASIERFINKSNDYDSLKKEYNQTGKVSNALMALNNKLFVLNFSGREYWYKYSKEYRTRGADQFPYLYKVCWSDNVPTRFTFGEDNE